MRCPTCGTENPTEAQFCGSCSVTLERRLGQEQAVLYCTSCGSENESAAQFCGQCGSNLRPSATYGDPSGGGVPYAGGVRVTGGVISRDLGELISETFKVYGGNFRGFFLIALLAQVPTLLLQLSPVTALSLVFVLAAITLQILAEGAIVFAVASQNLGREISVGECYRRAVGRFSSLLLAVIVFFLALSFSALLMLIIIGIPLLFYLLVSLFFYPQAILLEGKGPLQALGRSRELVRGSWWRVFGIGITFVILLLILNIAVIIPASISGFSSSTAAAILSTIGGSVVMPIGYIGATLVYFDLRIRKEVYTPETMAFEAGI